MVAKTAIAETQQALFFFIITLRTASNSSVHFLLWYHQIFEVSAKVQMTYIATNVFVCLYIRPCVSATFGNFSADCQAWCISQFYPELCFAVFLLFKWTEFTQILIWSISRLKIFFWNFVTSLEKKNWRKQVKWRLCIKKCDEREKRRTRKKKIIKGSKRTFSPALIYLTDFLLWC